MRIPVRVRPSTSEFGVKGSLQTDEPLRVPCGCGRVAPHSVKPDAFYDLVEKRAPATRAGELFRWDMLYHPRHARRLGPPKTGALEAHKHAATLHTRLPPPGNHIRG
jgi:hypothetical protein